MAEPQRLGFALERLFGHLGAPPIRTLGQLADHWDEIVGPGLAGHCRPAGLLDGVLRVQCDDPAWVSQIKWMEAQISERFRARFPDTDLRSIRASVAP
jgi:predicted nucleic acid-binding Zn ribbon protein